MSLCPLRPCPSVMDQSGEPVVRPDRVVADKCVCACVCLSPALSGLIKTMMIHDTDSKCYLSSCSTQEASRRVHSAQEHSIKSQNIFFILHNPAYSREQWPHCITAHLPVKGRGPPFLFYSFLSLHPRRLCHPSLSHLPSEMNYITGSVNNLWICAVA